MAELRELLPPPEPRADVWQQRCTRVCLPGHSTGTVRPFFFQTLAVSPHVAGHLLVWVAGDTNVDVSVLRAVEQRRHLPFEGETNKPKPLKPF